jgi:site-specific recombinase XerD
VYIPSPVGRPWGAGGVRLGPEELWAGWERWHLRRHLAPGTIDQRRRHLGMWLDWIGPRWAAATRADVERWVDAMPARSPKTRAVRVSSVTVFYRWARREGLTTANPTADWENPKLPKGLPRPARWPSIALALELEHDERVQLAIVLAAYAGLRRCEVATLQWHDVDLMRGVVYVEHGKGGKARFAFLPPEARHLFAAFDGSTGHVFARLDGQLVRDALDRADANASMHQLRHACATRAVDGGTPLEVVAELLGHESVETTRIYARLSATKVLEAAAAYWR